MINAIRIFFLLVIGLGILLSIFPIGDEQIVVIYKYVLEFCLFSFSAFLVSKRVFFYRFKGKVEVVKLLQRSEYFNYFILYGIIMALLYISLLNNFDELYSFNTILIAVLLLYYLVQVSIHANPSVYLDAKSFGFDNYFIQQWNWNMVKRIEVENDKLRVVGKQKDFEIDFSLINEFDAEKLADELDRNVLDGEFVTDDSSKSLIDILENYAHQNNVEMVRL